MKSLFKVLTITVIVFIIQACSKDRTPLKDCQEEVSFSAHIEPIISLNCSVTGCHDFTGSGGFVFQNYEQISSNASIILSAIRHEAGVKSMPLGAPKLADSLIQQFDCWMKQGKVNN